MFAEGMKVYFVEDGNVHSGYVIDVEKKIPILSFLHL